MSKSNVPLIRSLSHTNEEKKARSPNKKNTIDLSDNFTEPTQPKYKNSPYSMKEFKEYDEEIDIRDDQIFKRVIDKNNYSEASECEFCKTAFGLFKSRKNCGFCGKAVCKSHLVKKRENPQNPANFVRICESCEEKYLSKMVLDDFFKKKQKKDQELKEIEKRLVLAKQEFVIKQNDFSKAQSQREENEKIYHEKIILLSKNINKKKQQTDKIEEDSKQLNDKDIAINEAIKEETNKCNENKNELERLNQQCEDSTKELTQVEREIKHLSNIIAETEQKINVYKFNKDNKEPRESNQNNSFLLSLISNAEGSMLDIQASVSRIQNPKKKDQPLEEKKSCCLIF